MQGPKLWTLGFRNVRVSPYYHCDQDISYDNISKSVSVPNYPKQAIIYRIVTLVL